MWKGAKTGKKIKKLVILWAAMWRKGKVDTRPSFRTSCTCMESKDLACPFFTRSIINQFGSSHVRSHCATFYFVHSMAQKLGRLRWTKGSPNLAACMYSQNFEIQARVASDGPIHPLFRWSAFFWQADKEMGHSLNSAMGDYQVLGIDKTIT